MNSVFSRVGSVNPSRSLFDLSYSKLLSCNMGELIPVMCDEMVPGDKFKIGNEIVVRMQPLFYPILHEINCYVHYFFVPYRILWADWITFITKGKSGNEEVNVPKVGNFGPTTAPKSLWDYFGFPPLSSDITHPSHVSAFPWLAYNLVWNEYYRDEDLQDPRPAYLNRDGDFYDHIEGDSVSVTMDNFYMLAYRSWEKDYFTSARPWQQRGEPPGFPVSGSTSAVFTGEGVDVGDSPIGSSVPSVLLNSDLGQVGLWNTGSGSANRLDRLKSWLNTNSIDLDTDDVATFDVADLRSIIAVQRWMERNARAGVRYIEFLKSHFGAAPYDGRLDRPEYIGGTKSPVIISEVLQTSQTTSDSPQGEMAGHGICADRQFVASYRAEEFGCVIGLLSIMPRSLYMNGVDRQWLRSITEDFYFPEFANLSEQAIYRGELFYDGSDDDLLPWGFNGRYDEMRVKQSRVTSEFRDSLFDWSCARNFGSAPNLNGDFIRCDPAETKHVFNVTDPSVSGFLVNCHNRITAIRPLPIQSEPGLMDHV